MPLYARPMTSPPTVWRSAFLFWPVMMIAQPHVKAGAAIAGALERSGLTVAVTYRLPPASLTALGAMYFPYRFALLTAQERDLLEHNQGAI